MFFSMSLKTENLNEKRVSHPSAKPGKPCELSSRCSEGHLLKMQKNILVMAALQDCLAKPQV